MNKPFNQLSPAQVERLGLLAEECAEVIGVIGKILRHGLHSTHPHNPDGPDNLSLLEFELGHVHFAETLLQRDGLSAEKMAHSFQAKRISIIKYLHHQ